MPDHSNSPARKSTYRSSSLRWWNSLAFRLGATINIALVVVIAFSAWMDHRRDTRAQIQHALSRLQEEAHVLRTAWGQFDDPVDFQRFVDAFCRQMTSTASPGHHIAAFDSDGHVIVRAHEHADPVLERLMNERSANKPRTFVYKGERFASVSLNILDGAGLSVAVSLEPVEKLLRARGVSRAATTGVLVVIIFGVTALCLLIWVRNPLRGFVRAVSAVSEQRFEQLVEPKGAAELRFLADGINNMIGSLKRSEYKRASEMKRARQIQHALVGDRNLAVEGFQAEAIFLPAESVGGDLFDIVPLRNGSTLIAVIDVTGHGVPGALCAALLRSALRHFARITDDLAEIACGLNRELCDLSAADVFATAVLVRVRQGCEKFEYVMAGHDPPVLVAPDGRGETLEHGDIMLGVDPGACYSVSASELLAGGKIFLFTDGLHEALSPQDEQFGRERVLELFARTSDMPLEEQLSAALNSVRSFQGREEFDDDVTILAISQNVMVARSTHAVDDALCSQDATQRKPDVDGGA